MDYKLIKDVLDLIEKFQQDNASVSAYEIDDFKSWVATKYISENSINDPYWEGKELGRSADSMINTLIVHMNRFAKSYSKSAIFGSDFSTQEDFIYLINLKSHGEMTKIHLVKKNVHEKPAGIQVINRLIAQGWVNQTDSEIDKRSKVLKISTKGLEVLENQMDKIRKATEIVCGDLNHREKMELIRLLNKLNDFHQPIYNKNIEPEYLLSEAIKFKN
ncbi:MAG: winged helix-turn-helix transcriptional regulator [Chryseobacterium sp.]|nr:winged helix-turn-helix transcriptional regulator [Candidatus Chryseobacterium enterohippi]